MNWEMDEKLRALAEAGAELGKRCIALTPAQAGEDWRKAGAKELLRSAKTTGAAVFLDAYACARGSIRAARVHGEEAIALAPQALEAVLLAGGVQGLVAEIVENVRLPAEVRPEGFPTERDPDVRHALADARAWSLPARNLALRAAAEADAGTGDPSMSLAAACEAVIKIWPALSRLIIVEERYLRAEADLFRAASKAEPAALAAIATSFLGAPSAKGEATTTAEASPRRS